VRTGMREQEHKVLTGCSRLNSHSLSLFQGLTSSPPLMDNNACSSRMCVPAPSKAAANLRFEIR
jgi:hypothetical protein